MVSVTLKRGKADFILRRMPDEKTEKVCLCEWNADFSIRGCPAQVPGELLDEVMQNNGAYKKENRALYRKEHGGRLPDLRCDYCYGRRHNWGRIAPLEVNEKTRKEFEEKKPKVVRLGKLTEVGHPFYRKQLLDFLELCKEFGTSVIMPSKMLEFDERVAKLLKETKSVLNYSIGNDLMERGVCSQGFTNVWRIMQGSEYYHGGVNATLTITCDVTSSIRENIKRGFAVFSAIDFPDTIPKRLLPLRPNRRDLAERITGVDWNKMLYRAAEGDKLPFELEEVADPGRYILKGNGEAVPRVYHPDFRNFVNSFRLCGRIGDMEYCDGCHLDGALRQCFSASELVEVQYSPDKGKERRKYRLRQGTDRRQRKLF
jgi:hypothetical protein